MPVHFTQLAVEMGGAPSTVKDNWFQSAQAGRTRMLAFAALMTLTGLKSGFEPDDTKVCGYIHRKLGFSERPGGGDCENRRQAASSPSISRFQTVHGALRAMSATSSIDEERTRWFLAQSDFWAIAGREALPVSSPPVVS